MRSILTKHFVMKRSFVLILASFNLISLFAQAPYYIMFNTNFMDQLEYKYTYQGTVINSYTVKPSPTEAFMLTAANEGITSPTQPKGAVTYRDLRNNAELLNMVNNHTRNVYIVHPRTDGDFLLMPIISATYVVRNGAFYMVTAPNYAFALDTTRLINETNLATGKSPSYVYFTGMKFRDCRIEYAFRREPSRTNTERSDFEFMPGLGIISERSGKSASDAENNHMRLLNVDGIPLDDYLAAGCAGVSSKTTGSTISPYTPRVDYGSTPPATKPNTKSPTPYKEQNKEDVALQNKVNQQANNGREDFDFSKCPEQPGKGYHIVQPGDNLKAIARTYGKNEQDLITWNKIKNPNLIEVCQKIWLIKPPKATTIAKSPAVPAATYNTGSTGAKKVQNQSELWDEQGNQTPPLATQYNTKSPEYYGPSTKITKVAPAVAANEPTIHRVKSGDYLYKIAKEHGCIEECIRRANKMPLEGDITLWPGQELIIPECTCTLPASTTYYETPQIPVKSTPSTDEYYTPQANKSNLTSKSPNDQYYKPQGYNTNNPGPKAESANISSPRQDDRPDSGNNDGDQDTYFTEHVVKVGDTVNSIGYHYRVNAVELAQLNNLKPNDPLIAGSRLLIPHKK